MDMNLYWRAVCGQKEAELRPFFDAGAKVFWHHTGEEFSREDFLRMNRLYPGRWDFELQKEVRTERGVITATRIFSRDEGSACHVVSFFTLKEEKIVHLEEYWGDEQDRPAWRTAPGEAE